MCNAGATNAYRTAISTCVLLSTPVKNFEEPHIWKHTFGNTHLDQAVEQYKTCLVYPPPTLQPQTSQVVETKTAELVFYWDDNNRFKPMTKPHA